MNKNKNNWTPIVKQPPWNDLDPFGSCDKCRLPKHIDIEYAIASYKILDPDFQVIKCPGISFFDERGKTFCHYPVDSQYRIYPAPDFFTGLRVVESILYE